ncbi:MAG TPA: hypothetical protein VKA00_03555 [Trueperaceae bacterium]|nr:hypothetical protein [Trueperaceae bacterium]
MDEEETVKRLAWIALGLIAIALAACAPTPHVDTNVVPTLIAVTSPQTAGGTVVLQGRYFGDGQGGQASGSYVLVGADTNHTGGMKVTPTSWTPNRIEFPEPDNAGYGYVFVFVRGVPSNGLPANLP